MPNRTIALCLLFASSALAAGEEALESSPSQKQDVAKISEAMGHLIGKSIQDLGLDLDLGAVVKGMQDAAAGKTPPLNEAQCVQAIGVLQKETLSAASEKNLEEADRFLEKNRKEPGVVALEEGKIQYRIAKKGEGQIVQPYNTPLIRYSARYLDGTVFSPADAEELISLDETIPGFSKGILGMREGEARTLFVHPDFGYGKREDAHPNSLLIFEIEVVKADASAEAHAASNAEWPVSFPKTPPQ